MQTYDVVIIGGGHNGLTCAAYLGMAGLKVKVLERRAMVGGAAVTEEFCPGFRNSVAAYTVSLLNPKIIADLRLFDHGLKIVERRAQNFLPTLDGRYLLAAEGRTERQHREIQSSPMPNDMTPSTGRSTRVPMCCASWCCRRRPISRADQSSRAFGELLKAGRFGNRLRRLSTENLRTLLELFDEIGRRLSRWLVRGRTREGLARLRRHRRKLRKSVHARHRLCSLASCLRRGERQEASLGPRHRGNGCDHPSHGARRRGLWRGDRDRCARSRGLDREGQGRWRRARGRTHRPRRRGRRQRQSQAPLYRDDPAERARSGLSSAHAADGAAAPARSGSTSRSRSCRASRRCLDAIAAIITPPGSFSHRASATWIAPIATRERSDGAASRSSRWSFLRPWTTRWRPAGAHVASLFCQHVAPQLPDGRSWNDHRETVADLMIETVDRYAPGFKASVVGRQALSPFDLEQVFGLTGGDIFHGALSLDQLFWARPAARLCRLSRAR